MIPLSILEYLDSHGIPYERRVHPRAITAQELASSLHVPGRLVAKSVLVKAGEQIWIAVLPANENIDEDRLAAALNVNYVRLMREAEFARLFPECEPGAEPPFGGLYGLPVIVDLALTESPHILCRAGSHEEAIELRYADFHRLENLPRVAMIGRPQMSEPRPWQDWPWEEAR